MGHIIATYKNPETMPDISRPSRFDPLLGFPNGRKERPLPECTPEEMIHANLEESERDYCADKLLAYRKCVYEQGLIFSGYYCTGIKHEWFNCELHDHELRLKEYERERRLIARQRRADSLS